MFNRVDGLINVTCHDDMGSVDCSMSFIEIINIIKDNINIIVSGENEKTIHDIYKAIS
jgi:hypothetical protein